MSKLVAFPTRGRLFCHICDLPMLTVTQLNQHIRECQVRAERVERSRRAHPSNVASRQGDA